MAANETERGEHVVQFYETETELVSSVGRHLIEAAAAGEIMIVIATEAHRSGLAVQLEVAGLDVPQLLAQGDLISIDAEATLARFMTEDGVDAEAFHVVMGGLVRAAVRSGRQVRAYGEMVALLWEAGDVQAAIELETLWNELGSELPFSLFCAYPAELVFGTEHAHAFQQVCCAHSSVIDPEIHETPGVRTELRLHFGSELGAPGIARRLVVNALREQGHDEDVLNDVAVVLTELATNAVMHAETPFSVTVIENASMVRISVSDTNPGPPIRHDLDLMADIGGRGVALIAALASDWGFEIRSGGKIVWAELSCSAAGSTGSRGN